MARPRYQITQKDHAAAWRWISNAMDRDDISNVDGYMEFRKATTPEQLQAWCDDYLSPEAYKKLKNAILAARKRSRDYKHSKKKVGVDLDHLAHLRLSLLAEDLGKTLSETILIMEEGYLRARDAELLDKGW